jgi:hypothetical protein
MLQRKDKLTRGLLPQEFSDQTIWFPHDDLTQIAMRANNGVVVQKICAKYAFVAPSHRRKPVSSFFGRPAVVSGVELSTPHQSLGREHGYRHYLELCTYNSGRRYAEINRAKFLTCSRLMYRCPDGFDDGNRLLHRTLADSSRWYARRARLRHPGRMVRGQLSSLCRFLSASGTISRFTRSTPTMVAA